LKSKPSKSPKIPFLHTIASKTEETIGSKINLKNFIKSEPSKSVPIPIITQRRGRKKKKKKREREPVTGEEGRRNGRKRKRGRENR
jgi:hypothetical protein